MLPVSPLGSIRISTCSRSTLSISRRRCLNVLVFIALMRHIHWHYINWFIYVRTYTSFVTYISIDNSKFEYFNDFVKQWYRLKSTRTRTIMEENLHGMDPYDKIMRKQHSIHTEQQSSHAATRREKWLTSHVSFLYLKAASFHYEFSLPYYRDNRGAHSPIVAEKWFSFVYVASWKMMLWQS